MTYGPDLPYNYSLDGLGDNLPPSGGSGLGLAASVGGAVMTAIGAFYSVKAAQYQAESQALQLEHQGQMSALNARAAERDAQSLLAAGQEEAGRTGLRYRQIKGAVRARQAAAGIQSGVGSAAEVVTSVDLAKEADQLAITRNAVRAANASRTQRVNALNRGRFADLSATNLRRSAGSMNPWLSGLSSLIGSGASVSKEWYRYRRSQ